jgi:hypothetical protein
MTIFCVIPDIFSNEKISGIQEFYYKTKTFTFVNVFALWELRN